MSDPLDGFAAPPHRRYWPIVALVLAVVLVGVFLLRGERGQPDPPETAGASSTPEVWFTPQRLEYLLEPVKAELEAGAFPGAAVAVGVRDREFHTIGLGAIGWTRNAAPVDPDSTIYDLASITKVVATASAIMLLVDEGKLSLDELVATYLRDFAEGPKSAVTVRHLLTHTSGLPAGAELRRGNTRVERIAWAATFPIYPPAGARVEYSDVGFVLAWEVAERAAGEPLTQYLERRLYLPLGMTSTGYLPGLDCERCAPTGRLQDQSLYRGKPFDPVAQRLDGISGNAGLFSTARDLGRFAAMVTNGGELEGVRILSSEMAHEFTAAQPGAGRFRLGWETMCEEEVSDQEGCAEPLAIGHTGWTGTSIWIEPETGIWTILLTNRTYEPKSPNRLQTVRRELLRRATAPASSLPPPTLGDPEGESAGASPATRSLSTGDTTVDLDP